MMGVSWFATARLASTSSSRSAIANVHRIPAGITGPRHIEAPVTLADQHEDTFSARYSGLRAAQPTGGDGQEGV